MKVEAPFIHLIKLHTKYYLYDVNSKMIVNISNDLFDFFKSNENIKAEIEIPHKLEDEVRRLLKYDLFSMILSILVYTFFTRMFDFMLPLVVKYSIVAA